MKYLFFLFILTLIPFSTSAQVDGLWETTSVKVGEEVMTPVAKWTHLKQSRMFTSGNGWLQNMSGYWNYDRESRELELNVTTGFENEFGPFKVEMVSEDEMIWTRIENGEQVTVVNKRIQWIPKSPATKAVGLWKVNEVITSGKDFTDEYLNETGIQGVFIRWDNLFQEITKEGTISGIWRVNAHRPVLDVLFYDRSREMQYWNIEFEGVDTMIWSKDEMNIKYTRLDSFPED